MSAKAVKNYMKEAIELARISASEGEVPVGCVVVWDDKIVGRGRNRREIGKNALAHAEIEAINEACRTLGGWRLWKASLFVTLEPCPMCAGAIINARIPFVYFGADDIKGGACGSVTNLFDMKFNHRPEVIKGILKEECAEMLSDFFKRLRNRPAQ